MENKIELTKEELEEIKDTIKFRTMVALQLKRLNGIPEMVIGLRVKIKTHTWVLRILIGLFIGLVCVLLGR